MRADPSVYLGWYLYARYIRLDLCTLLAAYTTAEIVFSFYMFYLCRSVQRASPPSLTTQDRRLELLQKIMTADLGRHGVAQGVWDALGSARSGEVQEDEVKAGLQAAKDGQLDYLEKLHPSHPRAIEFRETLRNWQVHLVDPADPRFGHAPWDEIKHRNVMIWLAFACYNCPLEEIEHDEGKMALVNAARDMLEARTGTVFEPGYNSKITVMRLTLDPVNVSEESGRADHRQKGDRSSFTCSQTLSTCTSGGCCTSSTGWYR